MRYQTSQEHEALRAVIREFAETEVKPIAFMMDKENEELNNKLDTLTEEYNNLVEQYNHLQYANKDLTRKYKHNLDTYKTEQHISR